MVQFAVDVTDLEDGEILTTVKMEPRCSDVDYNHASVGRRWKRFSSSSVAHHSSDGDHINDGVNGSLSGSELQSSARVVRKAKKIRRSKDTNTPAGHPGHLLTFQPTSH